MYYKQIINGINNAIESIPGLPVLFKENTQNKPVDPLTPWMRSTILPSEPTQVSIGYERQMRYIGIIQVDYMVPPNTGSTANNIDVIVNWFNDKDNRFINNDGVDFMILAAWRGTSFTGEKWYQTPIYLRYQFYDGQ